MRPKVAENPSSQIYIVAPYLFSVSSPDPIRNTGEPQLCCSKPQRIACLLSLFRLDYIIKKAAFVIDTRSEQKSIPTCLCAAGFQKSGRIAKRWPGSYDINVGASEMILDFH